MLFRITESGYWIPLGVTLHQQRLWMKWVTSAPEEKIQWEYRVKKRRQRLGGQ